MQTQQHESIRQEPLYVKPFAVFHVWRVYSYERSPTAWKFQGTVRSITKTKSVVVKKAKADSPVLRGRIIKCEYVGVEDIYADMMLANSKHARTSWPANYVPDLWGEYDLLESEPTKDPILTIQ